MIMLTAEQTNRLRVSLSSLMAIVRIHEGNQDPKVTELLAVSFELYEDLIHAPQRPDPAACEQDKVRLPYDAIAPADVVEADTAAAEQRVFASDDFEVVPCEPTPEGFAIMRRALDEATPIPAVERLIKLGGAAPDMLDIPRAHAEASDFEGTPAVITQQLHLTNPERDALLAGLRLLQIFYKGELHGMGRHGEYIEEILTPEDEGYSALTIDQIDTLCEELNR